VVARRQVIVLGEEVDVEEDICFGREKVVGRKENERRREGRLKR